jgi:predicted fused transcriptional regulator/phosphomethylpyrimidine kinase
MVQAGFGNKRVFLAGLVICKKEYKKKISSLTNIKNQEYVIETLKNFLIEI